MDSFIADYGLIQGAKPNDNCKPTQNAELYLLCFLILCGNLLLLDIKCKLSLHYIVSNR